MGFESVDCIDVSYWQGLIDWNKVRDSGVKNTYIRATIGVSGVDLHFDRNRANNPVPASFYSLFKGNLDGEKQADHFINTIERWNLSLPPAIDVESVIDDDSTPEERTEQLKRMVERIQTLTGQLPVIYTGLIWNNLTVSRYDHLFSQCKLWVAQYNNNPFPSPLPRGWSKWWLHQYSSNGNINGIVGRVDLNRFNQNF